MQNNMPKKNIVLVFVLLAFIALSIALYIFNKNQDSRGMSPEDKKILEELESMKRRPNDTKTDAEVLKGLESLKAPNRSVADEKEVLKELENLKP